MKQYLVIGLGRFGTSVAKTLYEAEKNVLAIDIDEELVQEKIDANIIKNALIDCYQSISIKSKNKI